MSYVVYGLEDPRDHLYHYIGITDDVYKRFHEHVTGSGGNIKKNGWIFECRQANIMIIMREIERTESSIEAEQREAFWIGYYLSLGHPLQNTHVVRSILEEKNRLERQYITQLGEQARIVEQARRLEEKVLRPPKKKKTYVYKQSLSPATETIILKYRAQGLRLKDIATNIGLSYYQVQRVYSNAKSRGLISPDHRD